MSGWLKFSRSMVDHPYVGIANPKRFAAWMWMLSEARFEDFDIEIGGKPVTLKRGQFSHSLRFMSDKTGLTFQQIRTFLDGLESRGMCSKTNTAGNTAQSIITICNYDKYQSGEIDPDTQNNTAITQQQHSDNTKSKKERIKEGKKDTNVSTKSPPLFSLFPSTVSESVAKAYVAHRKKKRAPLSEHIVELICAVLVEAEGAGISADAALNHAMLRGWTGLELDWLLKALAPTPTNGERNERPRNQGGRPATVPNRPSSLAGVLAESRARDQANSFDEDAGGGRDSLGAGRRDESFGDGSGWGGHGGGPSVDAEYSEVIPFQALASSR